jgi:hypothetical protein
MSTIGVDRSLFEWAVYVKWAAWTVPDGNREIRHLEIGGSTPAPDGLAAAAFGTLLLYLTLLR